MAADPIDLRRLGALIDGAGAGFATAAPFPHLVVDDVCHPDTLRAVVAEFGHADDGWTYWHHANERKRGLADRQRMGPAARALIEAWQQPAVVRLLERLTGVTGLLADPALDGGGLHETLPGGFLNVHTDYLAHPTRRSWTREVNLLVYLNETWAPAHRGWLELWDAGVSACVRRIEPRFNRCVIFRTSSTSFHGVPEGVTCPAGDSRKSVALYYFRDAGRVHRLRSTRYVPRPGDPLGRRIVIRADRALVHLYSLVKRYTPLGDRAVSRVLRRL